MSSVFSTMFSTARHKPRRLLIVLFAGIALVVAPVAVDALTSPSTWVNGPEDGSTVTGDLVVRGQARHSKGVASVEVVVKNLDQSVYWNGESWQSGFVQVDGAVSNVGSQKTQWTYTVPASAMEKGNYRARAFARSTEGNGDSHGGDINEFRYIPYLDAALYNTEIVSPARSSVVNGPISIQGHASSTDGVDRVVVSLRSSSTNQYWDGTKWTEAFNQVDAKLDHRGATKVSWSVDVPVGSSNDGSYFARAWVRTSTDLGDPFGEGRTSFKVVADSPAVVVATEPADTPTKSSPTVASSTPTAPATAKQAAPKQQPAEAKSTTTASLPTTQPAVKNAPTEAKVAAPTTVKVAPSTTIEVAAPAEAKVAAPTQPPTTKAEPVKPPAPTADCPTGNPSLLVPCAGLMIGASGDFKNPDGSIKYKQDDFNQMEARLNAKFDIYHDFLQWDGLTTKQFPPPKTQAISDSGHTLFVNWKSPTSHPRDWSEIAKGTYDADIKRAAGQVREFDEPMFITFFHEPEDEIRDVVGSGEMSLEQTLTDYSAAYRHLHNVFEAEGADNAIWVWTMMGYLGGFESYYEGGLYPGDDVVDWVGWDPYNWFSCATHPNTKWTSFTDVVAPFYDWLNAGGPGRPSKSKPLMLAEFGSAENVSSAAWNQTKAAWFDEAGQVLPTKFPRIKAAVYFDTEGRRADGSTQFCEMGLDTSDSSLRGMGRLMNAPKLDPVWSGD